MRQEQRVCLSFLEICRHFAPGWFASVMGTGVLSLTTHALALRWHVLMPLAWGLHFFNIFLFVLLAVPWLSRWIIFREAALATLKHPVQASFYPTFSIAMLVIAAQFLVFGTQIQAAMFFWSVGALITIGFSFAILFSMFSGEHVGLEHVTPAKFIPAVGLVVIPVAGAPLLDHCQGEFRNLVLLLNIAGLGAGLLMYVGLFSLTLQRKYLARPAFGILTPTVWIHLAPLGIIPVSLLNLAERLPFSVPTGALLLAGLFFWSFGLWWLIMAALLTRSARRRGMLPFALSWWGFTFPLGAFVVSSFRLASVSGLEIIGKVGTAVWIFLLIVWLITLAGTIRGALSGDIFRPHP